MPIVAETNVEEIVEVDKKLSKEVAEKTMKNLEKEKSVDKKVTETKVIESVAKNNLGEFSSAPNQEKVVADTNDNNNKVEKDENKNEVEDKKESQSENSMHKNNKTFKHESSRSNHDNVTNDNNNNFVQGKNISGLVLNTNIVALKASKFSPSHHFSDHLPLSASTNVDPKLHLLDFQLRNILKKSPAREENHILAGDASHESLKKPMEGDLMTEALLALSGEGNSQETLDTNPLFGRTECKVVNRVEMGKGDVVMGDEVARREMFVSKEDEQKGESSLFGSNMITALSSTNNAYLDDHATRAAPFTLASVLASLGFSEDESEMDDMAQSSVIKQEESENEEGRQKSYHLLKLMEVNKEKLSEKISQKDFHWRRSISNNSEVKRVTKGVVPIKKEAAWLEGQESKLFDGELKGRFLENKKKEELIKTRKCEGPAVDCSSLFNTRSPSSPARLVSFSGQLPSHKFLDQSFPPYEASTFKFSSPIKATPFQFSKTSLEKHSREGSPILNDSNNNLIINNKTADNNKDDNFFKNGDDEKEKSFLDKRSHEDSLKLKTNSLRSFPGSNVKCKPPLHHKAVPGNIPLNSKPPLNKSKIQQNFKSKLQQNNIIQNHNNNIHNNINNKITQSINKTSQVSKVPISMCNYSSLDTSAGNDNNNNRNTTDSNNNHPFSTIDLDNLSFSCNHATHCESFKIPPTILSHRYDVWILKFYIYYKYYFLKSWVN